jgi:hypothetical protein
MPAPFNAPWAFYSPSNEFTPNAPYCRKTIVNNFTNDRPDPFQIGVSLSLHCLFPLLAVPAKFDTLLGCRNQRVLCIGADIVARFFIDDRLKELLIFIGMRAFDTFKLKLAVNKIIDKANISRQSALVRDIQSPVVLSAIFNRLLCLWTLARPAASILDKFFIQFDFIGREIVPYYPPLRCYS